jgi:hypothetical protein
MNEEEGIIVFTARSPERIIREGGSQAWVLNAARAKQCKWLVCTQNRHHRDHEFSDATQEHGAAFLVGKVSGVARVAQKSADGKHRWLVTISDYALVNVPEFWDQDRNPVRYLLSSDIKRRGINPGILKFEPIRSSPLTTKVVSSSPVRGVLPRGVPPLTIAEAREGLAATFGVNPDAVEITIRG